jgi:nucleoside-diphosphate-sugar epimerase
MTVLITGGAGLIGLYTARRLAEDGVTPICLDIKPRPDTAAYILGEHAEAIPHLEADVLNYDVLSDIVRVRDIEGIIHAAAVVNENVFLADPLTGIKVNTIGTANMLELAREHGLRRVVFTSSGTIYGPSAGKPLFEGDEDPKGFYAETKNISERLMAQYREKFGVSSVAVRISSVYGPGKVWNVDHYPMQRLLLHALKGEPFEMAEGGDYVRDFTYGPDAAKGTVLAYDKEAPAYTEYNVAVGKLYSVSEVADILNRTVPDCDLTVGSGSFEGNMALAGSLRGALDITRAREDLGFEPDYPLEKGLKAYVDYLRANPDVMAD